MYIPENWGELEQPGLRRVFEQTARTITSNIPALYNVQTSSKAQEFDLQTDDKSNWETFDDDIKYDSEVQGYKTTYTHDEIVTGKKIKKKLLDDDQYGVITRIPRKMATGGMRRRERDGASTFNNAFNSGFTGGDSLSLCNTAHTSKNDASLTRSNSGVLSLSDANIETTRQLMIEQTSGTSEPLDVMPDMIIAPLALERQAWEVLSSKGKVDTAQNNANFHMGKYKLIIWPNYLTGKKRWFMVDSTYMKEFLLWFNRQPMQFFKDRDFGTLVSAFAGYMRYSKGWSDWTWIYGHNPA